MPDGAGFTIGTSAPTQLGAAELILSAAAPLNSARAFIQRQHMHDGMRTLHHQNGIFYTWEGTHYIERPNEEMRALLYAFLDKAQRIDPETGAKVPFDPSKNKVANVQEALAAAVQLPSTTRPPAWLTDTATRPPAGDLIACKNGLLSLDTMTLHPLTPAFFSLNALSFAYDPAAGNPTEWLRFLSTIWPDDPESIETLQELFGLLLTADTRHQKAFLIVGPKRSGKGTIGRVMAQLLGPDNVCGPTLSSLSGTFGMQTLIGKRLAIVSDARLSGKADQAIITERLLSVTGEDGQSVDRKNRTAWFGKLDARFVIMTNELPRLNDTSGALAGRFVILKMTESFYGREDLGLGEKLAAEMPSILVWAIAGYKRLKQRGYFITPQSAKDAQQELDDLGSPIGAFLRARCEIGQGLAVQCDQLYGAWCAWCREQGRDHAGTKQTFGRDLGAAGAGLKVTQPRSSEGRHRYYEGLTVVQEASPSGGVARDGTRTGALYPQLLDDPYFSDDPGP